MGAAKNILMGIVHALIAAVSYVILPYIGLTTVKNLDLGSIGTIDFGRFDVDEILYYLEGLGIILVAIGFAKGSSPKYSKRRAGFALMQVFGSAIYVYVIRFSGMSNIPIVLSGIGTISVNFDSFMYMMFGIICINAILAIFDIAITIKDQLDGSVEPIDVRKEKGEEIEGGRSS